MGDKGDVMMILAGEANATTATGSPGCKALPRRLRARSTTCLTAVRAFIDASLTWNAFAKKACRARARQQQ